MIAARRARLRHREWSAGIGRIDLHDAARRVLSTVRVARTIFHLRHQIPDRGVARIFAGQFKQRRAPFLELTKVDERGGEPRTNGHVAWIGLRQFAPLHQRVLRTPHAVVQLGEPAAGTRQIRFITHQRFKHRYRARVLAGRVQ